MSSTRLPSLALNAFVVTVTICAVVSWYYAHTRASRHPSEHFVTALLSDGMPFPSVRALPGSDARSLVLVLSTSCPFCNRSAGFYRDLTSPRDVPGGRDVTIVFPFPWPTGGLVGHRRSPRGGCAQKQLGATGSCTWIHDRSAYQPSQRSCKSAERVLCCRCGSACSPRETKRAF
jgi:hypothetical protein